MQRVPALLIVALLPCLAIADDAVDYVRDVKPILARHCYACHGALRQRGGLRLDTARLVGQGGEHGPAVKPGASQESLLIQRVTGRVEPRMPLEGKSLSEKQIAVLRAWIAAGAKGPADEKPQKDPKDHWAFRPPVRPALPAVTDQTWVRNPIDAFIAAEHEKRGLQPRPPAEKHVLLRRVTLDLTGLPPTREQLHAFLADTSDAAYERLVDRLLASPQYGERWGRHWMDVWRYSDWYGRRQVNDVRNSYPHIWRWRDWIVRSLNEDKGYDRMIQEMLAADEIDPESDENIVALGFIVRNWFSLNYDQWMKDLVEHTGKAFLGVRLNCAHCHDHKYDPISQEEYFRFRAFFEPLELRHDRVPGGPALTKYQRYTPGSGASLKPIAAGLARVFDENLKAATYMYKLGDARNRFDRPPVPPGAPAILGGDELEIQSLNMPPTAWYPGLKPFVQEAEIAQRASAATAAEEALASAKKELGPRLAALGEKLKEAGKKLVEASAGAKLLGSELERVKLESDAMLRRLEAAESRLAAAQAQQRAIEARVAADCARYLNGPGDGEALAAEAVRAERLGAVAAARSQIAVAGQAVAEAKVKAASDAKAADGVQKALQQHSAAEKSLAAAEQNVDSGGTEYTPLGPTYPKTSTGRRRALARWIGSTENPLAARVAVNHIWMRHFGRPLVESVFDFGNAGKAPTHPELLDWLAVEFADSGWSMKHVHRLIVTSNTYRMQSKADVVDGANLAMDKDNRYWWRFERRRAEAEVVRDSVLHASRQLDMTLGGPELATNLEATSKRRSMYFALYPEGGGTMQFASTFDAPDPGDCYRRRESIVPQQALAMTNSNVVLDASRVLGKDLWQGRAEEFAVAAYEQILSRRPKPEELAACIAFLDAQRELYKQSSPDALQGATVDAVPAAADLEVRAAESLVRVLFSHNDFVVIP